MPIPLDVNPATKANNATGATSTLVSEIVATILGQLQTQTGRDLRHYQAPSATPVTYGLDFWQAIAEVVTELQHCRAREAQAQFHTNVLQQISEAVITVDRSARITYLNPAAAALYEIEAATALGQPLHTLHDFAWLPPEAALIDAATLADQADGRSEARLVKRNGSVLQVESTVRLLYEAHGQPSGLLVCSHDITARKQTEIALQASEARYRQLADAMPQLVWTATTAGVVDYYNIRIHDYDPAVWQGAYGFDWQRLLHPDDLAPTLRAWERAAAHQESFVAEHRLRMADGSWRWHLSRAVLARGGLHGSRWYGTATDIHEHKLAEAELRQHLNELEAIYKTAPVGLCVMDKELRYVRINERLAAMNGYPAAYHIGRTGRELFPDLAEKTEAKLQQVLATGEAIIGLELTGELPTQPGVQHTWIESWFPLHDAAGAVVGINIMIQEITAEKQAELALRTSAERLHLATEAGGIGIFDHDLRTNQTEISEIYAQITGLPLDTVVTREAWLACVHPEDRPLIAAIWDQAKATGASYYYECRLVRPDGALVWIEVNAWVTSDELGQGIRITGAIRDITERKLAALHQQFLLNLNATLRKLSDPATIEQTVVKRLGEYLGVTHCRFNAIDLAADRAILLAAWSASGSTGGSDVNPLSTYASPEYIADAKAGRTLVVHNTVQDERPVNAQRLLLEKRMHAMIRVPCLREGHWEASLHVLQDTPRTWRADEVQLVENVVHHFWPLVEKARAEEALRASERRFRQLADTMPQVVWTSQADGTITYINQPWSIYSGMTLAETLAQGMWPALHPADAAANRAQWQRALERGEPYESEVRIRRHDGVYRWFLERALPVYDESGAIQQWFGVSMDITDRKAAEEALVAREAFLRAVTDAVPNAIGYVDQQQRYRFVNATYAQWLARPRPAIEGCTMAEVLGEQVYHWQQYWARALAGETVCFEETVTYPDQGTRTVLGTYIPDPDEAGQVRGFYLYLNDITARKAAEAAVAAHAAELRLITDNILGFISYVDRDHRYRFVNAAYEELYQQSRKQIAGQPLRNLLGDAVYAQVQPYIDAALQGETLQFEATLAYVSGIRTIWATYVPDIDQDGCVQGFYALVTDISERKAVEEALRQSEDTALQRLSELEAIYDTAPIGLCVLDRELRWVRINERLAEINGFPAAAHIGRSVQELLPDLAPAAVPIFKHILESNQPIINIELHGQTPAQPGVDRIWLEHWFPLHDHSGAVIGINVVAEEITERKRQEQELKELNATLEERVRDRTAALEQANQELARSNRELEQFNYAAAHDLKSPLRGIQHLVQWIGEDAADRLPPTSQKHLTLLRGRVQRLETLLDDMLAYSRIGRVRYPPEKVDLNLLIHSMSDLLAPPPGFTVVLPEPLPTLHTMRAPLEAVLRNLLSNAIKHHHQPAQGQVTITTRTVGEWLEFVISDNGPGIDPIFHERIFGMFQTLQPRDQVEGSGVGLALVKKTVESYGGQIHIESTIGQGSIFRFTWPLG